MQEREMFRCAVCDEAASTEDGTLDPYRDVSMADGWSHELAHLDCARYRVATVYIQPA